MKAIMAYVDYCVEFHPCAVKALIYICAIALGLWLGNCFCDQLDRVNWALVAYRMGRL